MEDIRFYGWGVGSLQNAGVSSDGHNDGARGYLRRLEWVGPIGEWHEGQALTPIGLQAFANFVDMPESRVPSALKQVPYLSELDSAATSTSNGRKRASVVASRNVARASKNVLTLHNRVGACVGHCIGTGRRRGRRSM